MSYPLAGRFSDLAFCPSERRDAVVYQVAIRNETINGELRSGKNSPDGPLISRRRVPHHGPKKSTERAQALIAHSEADLGYGEPVVSEQPLGPIDPQLGNELVGCLAEGMREQPMIVKRRETGFPRGICQAHRLVNSRRQPVA